MNIGDKIISKVSGNTVMKGFKSDRSMDSNETGIIIGIDGDTIAIRADKDNATLVRKVNFIKIIENLEPQVINNYSIY